MNERQKKLERIQYLNNEHLDMYGKRWMFFKIFFPKMCLEVALEGSTLSFTLSVWDYLEEYALKDEYIKKMEEIFGQ